MPKHINFTVLFSATYMYIFNYYNTIKKYYKYFFLFFNLKVAISVICTSVKGIIGTKRGTTIEHPVVRHKHSNLKVNTGIHS